MDIHILKIKEYFQIHQLILTIIRFIEKKTDSVILKQAFNNNHHNQYIESILFVFKYYVVTNIFNTKNLCRLSLIYHNEGVVS